METKAELRKRILKIRSNINPEDRIWMDERIFKHLSKLDCINEADSVLVYVSYNGEADTIKLIKYLLENGKKVATPRVNGDDMDFYEIKSLENLVDGYKGIPEPSKDCSIVYPEGKSIILVPGSAFDKNLFRMGYGKGYYDRYIAMHKGMFSIGISYGFQIQDRIPIDEWDRSLDMIVTEREVICYE